MSISAINFIFKNNNVHDFLRPKFSPKGMGPKFSPKGMGHLHAGRNRNVSLA